MLMNLYTKHSTRVVITALQTHTLNFDWPHFYQYLCSKYYPLPPLIAGNPVQLTKHALQFDAFSVSLQTRVQTLMMSVSFTTLQAFCLKIVQPCI